MQEANCTVKVDEGHIFQKRCSTDPLSGLYLPGSVCGKKVDFIIDTGSSTTILSHKIFSSITSDQSLELSPCHDQITVADGRPLTCKGYCDIQINFGSKIINHRTLIADIEPDGLIGLDFLHTHDACINIRDSLLVFDDISVSLRSEYVAMKSCFVRLKETVTVPANTEAILIGSVRARGESPPCGIIEPTSKFAEKHQILVAKTLVDPRNAYVPLRVMNITSEDKILYKGTHMGIMQPVLEIVKGSGVELEGDKGYICNSDIQLPRHLEDLYKSSSTNLSLNESNKVKQLLIKHQDVFSTGSTDLGRTDIIRHKIDTNDAKPVRLPPRRIPIHLQAEVDAEINKMIESKVIRPSKSPWASCIVNVRKPDGSLRVCQDYRRLNALTVKDSYPLPRIDMSLDRLAGSRWFSTLDLASGFYQVEVDPDDIPKTAFSTRRGLFEFVTMPFGLCNAPATFERLMERVMTGLQWEILLIYIDDLIVFAKSFDEMLLRLEKVFDRLRSAKLKLKPNKCTLFRKSVSFLGHLVSENGVQTDPAKVDKVKNWSPPNCVKEVRAFLGLCSYYRRFIEGYSKIAAPLHRLTEKKREFIWSQECQEAFSTLKSQLTSAPVLAFPSEIESFILDTDASDDGIGAVLSQVQNEKERVIAYAGRSLTKAERRYCVTRKELLAVVFFITYFKHYLYGRKFLLRTDHGSLRWLFNFKSPEGQVARWLEVLGTFDFNIEHRPGPKHGNADALSRLPCKQCGSGIIDEDLENSEDVRKRAKQLHSTNRDMVETIGFKLHCNMVRRHSNKHTYVTNTNYSSAGALSSNTFQRPSEPSWLQEWSTKDIRQMQLTDENISQVLKSRSDRQVKPGWEEMSSESVAIKALWSEWDRLNVNNGVLYIRWDSALDFQSSWRLVVPKDLKPIILKSLHGSPTSGHLGIGRTLAAAKPRFYWFRMKSDIESWVKQCNECCSRKPNPGKKHAKLKQYLVGAPLERVAMDICGPFPRSRKGNKYILVIADYFTKFVEAYPMRNMEASTVADFFVKEFVFRYGVPRQIHTDQGTNFNSALFKELCLLLGIQKTRTTGFHPQSDGLVERFNRTLLNMLSMFVSESQKDWDEWIPAVMFAYRATPQASTKFSPNLLMFGRETFLPIDLMVGLPPSMETPDEQEYVTILRDHLEKAHAIARQNTKFSAIRQKKLYDTNVKEQSFKAGDYVWLYTPIRKKGFSAKLQRHWRGPYLVLNKIGETNYRIQQNPKAKMKIVHANRLNDYKGLIQKSLGSQVKNTQNNKQTIHSHNKPQCSNSHNDTEQITKQNIHSRDKPHRTSSQNDAQINSPDKTHTASRHVEKPIKKQHNNEVLGRRRPRKPERFGEWI